MTQEVSPGDAPSAPPKPTRADLLWQFERQLAAARAVLAEPACAAEQAIPDLLEAWSTLGELVGQPTERREEIEALCTRLEVHREFTLENPVATVDVMRRVLEEGQPPARWRAPLRRHADRLHRVGIRLTRMYGLEPRATTAWRWFARGLIATGLVVGAYLAIEQPWLNWNHGPWRAAYYPTKNFKGKPVMRREMYLDHDWGKQPAVDSIPANRFSARWDSCLEIEKKTKIPLQLVADDHARLFIGGTSILSKWHRKKNTEEPVGAVVEFRPGVHHLKVEFEEEKSKAEIHLLASFDGERPDRIPPDRLRFPGLQAPDDSNPCGAKAPKVKVIKEKTGAKKEKAARKAEPPPP